MTSVREGIWVHGGNGKPASKHHVQLLHHLVKCLWIPTIAQITQVDQEHSFTCSVKCQHPCASDERKCTSCTSLVLKHSSRRSAFVESAFNALVANKLLLETKRVFSERQRKCISKPFSSLICRIQKHPLSIAEYNTKNQHISEVQIWAKVEMTEIAASSNLSPLAPSPVAALKGC